MSVVKRILTIVIVVLVVLVLAGAASWPYLTARQAFPERSSYVIDLEALERVAREGGGSLPVAVQHELVAIAGMPKAAIFAGESFDPHDMGHGGYRIAWDDGRSVLVDTAFSAEAMAQFPGEGRFDERAFEKLQETMLEADAVVLTHEHFDHIAGLGEVEDVEAFAPRLVMNPEQLASDEAQQFMSDELRAAVTPRDYEETMQVAPGVVLLRAPGHTEGSQIVYVLPEEGPALLLIGDVAWHLDQIRNEHYRPRLVTDFMLGEDRDAVLNQMRALKDLLGSEQVVVVSSHDLDDRRRLIDAGIIEDGIR